MIGEGGEPRTDTIAHPWYAFGLVQAKMPPVWLLSGGEDVRGQAFGDASLPRPQCLGVVNVVAAIGALRGAHRAEVLGEGRFELLRDHHERPPLLHEERRMLLDELERERRERLEAQGRVKQLMR